jgi:hypothetical protein
VVWNGTTDASFRKPRFTSTIFDSLGTDRILAIVLPNMWITGERPKHENARQQHSSPLNLGACDILSQIRTPK